MTHRVEQAMVATLIVSLVLMGCAPSQVGVELSGSVPSDAVYLRVRTCGQDGMAHADRTLPLAEAPLPRTIWIDPLGTDVGRVFHFSATLLDASMDPLQSVDLIDRFPASGPRKVERSFDAECLRITCASTQTCSEGACVDAVAPGLSPAPDILARVTGCRPPSDAGVDAGPGDGGHDAGPGDAGYDAGNDAGTICNTAGFPVQCSVSDMLSGDCLPSGCEVLFGHPAAPTDAGFVRVPSSRVRVNRFDAPGSLQIAGVYVLLEGSAPELIDVIGVIYSNEADLPSALRLVSPPVSVAPATVTVSEGWWYLPFIGAGVLSEGRYWAGFMARSIRGTTLYHGAEVPGFTGGRIGAATFGDGPMLTWLDYRDGAYPLQISIVAVGTRQ